MRIISGKFKGRRFYPPAGNWPTRPTTDFAKEALFNILNNRFDFEAIRVLDLFGGTSSPNHGFFFRGWKKGTYVDQFGPCVKFVTEMATKLNIGPVLRIARSDVFRFIQTASGPYDYIFAGPPYALPNIPAIPDLIFQRNLLDPKGLLVVEHNQHQSFPDHPHFLEVRHYGKTFFSFFAVDPEAVLEEE